MRQGLGLWFLVTWAAAAPVAPPLVAPLVVMGDRFVDVWYLRQVLPTMTQRPIRWVTLPGMTLQDAIHLWPHVVKRHHPACSLWVLGWEDAWVKQPIAVLQKRWQTLQAMRDVPRLILYPELPAHRHWQRRYRQAYQAMMRSQPKAFQSMQKLAGTAQIWQGNWGIKPSVRPDFYRGLAAQLQALDKDGHRSAPKA